MHKNKKYHCHINLREAKYCIFQLISRERVLDGQEKFRGSGPPFSFWPISPFLPFTRLQRCSDLCILRCLFQVQKRHRACDDIILALCGTSGSDPEAAGPQNECPLQSACPSGSDGAGRLVARFFSPCRGAEIVSDLQRPSEILKQGAKKPPAGFLVSHDSAESSALLRGFLIKGSPDSHHVALLRCACSHIDVEDVELWACWICLP